MKTQKITFLFIFSLYSFFCFSQDKTNSYIIKRDIKVIAGNDVYDFPADDPLFMKGLTVKKYNYKSLVYYDGKFFSSDTINSIKNLNEFEFISVKPPKNITKDVESIIYMKKLAK